MLLSLFSRGIIAVAVGEGNIDNGGGDLGNGTGESYWSSGNEGVRVTIIKADSYKIVGESVDMTNKRPSDDLVHFEKVSKYKYVNGTKLSVNLGGYIYKRPTRAIPKIIMSSSGNGNIEEIKNYFTDKLIVEYIAQAVDIDYNILISGNYKILLEPIAYV